LTWFFGFDVRDNWLIIFINSLNISLPVLSHHQAKKVLFSANKIMQKITKDMEMIPF
jgi:hypothetical protein